jgi:hypothetical protein
MPSCPQCGAVIDVDWIDVREVGDRRALWLPGQMRCPTNEDHDVTSLYGADWCRETLPLFYIDDGPGTTGNLKIDQEWHRETTNLPQPDPRWEHTDSNGHYHARSEDQADPYPTLLSHVEQAACDGSCGGVCDGEGYSVTRYFCRACQNEIEPGVARGMHLISIPGLKSWTAEVAARVPLDGPVSVRVDCGNEVLFGIAQCISTEGGRFGPDEPTLEFKSSLVGVGPLGRRKA